MDFLKPTHCGLREAGKERITTDNMGKYKRNKGFGGKKSETVMNYTDTLEFQERIFSNEDSYSLTKRSFFKVDTGVS